MSSFSLHIATDNAAFGDQPASELAAMLRELAHKLDRGTAELDPADKRHGANEGTVRDHNGNTCGRWFWTDRYATHDDAAALDRTVHIIEHRDDLNAGQSFLATVAEVARLTGRTVTPAPEDDDR